MVEFQPRELCMELITLAIPLSRIAPYAPVMGVSPTATA